jgi:hypothetical protein
MLPAVTLVHKGAMPIAVHAVASFARHFNHRYRLDIHTDGSPDAADEETLLQAAHGIQARIVRPEDRQPVLDERLAAFPRIRALLDGVGYFAKMELPMVINPPFFYFDSDIVWLRPVSNLEPQGAPNAFSTESWSWYNGVCNDRIWIAEKTPRRVNSGFYYLGEPFPFERMEDMLARGMFDPTKRYNTDQEIMAYLFRDMVMYHPDDLKRSRVRVCYDLANESCTALHFPGGMWREHLDQIARLGDLPQRPATTMRFQPPLPLTRAELLRMRFCVGASDSPLLQHAINDLRDLRGRFSSSRSGC